MQLTEVTGMVATRAKGSNHLERVRFLGRNWLPALLVTLLLSASPAGAAEIVSLTHTNLTTGAWGDAAAPEPDVGALISLLPTFVGGDLERWMHGLIFCCMGILFLVYPPRAKRCEMNGYPLSVTCPVDGTVREASLDTCSACGTKYKLGANASDVVVRATDGPPEGGAAIA